MAQPRKISAPELRLPQNRSRVRGLLVGLVLVLVGLLAWFSFRGGFSPPTVTKGQESRQAQVPAGAQPESAPPPARQETILKNQLEQVLAGIREANQKKDLPQLLSLYSSNFQQLTQRTQNISKAWKIYDYPNMEFKISKATLLSDNLASARVEWSVEARNISTQETKVISKTYLINFTKESGQWRLNAIKEAQ